MKRCREIVGLFNQSNQMNEVLIAAQVSLNKNKPPLQYPRCGYALVEHPDYA